MLQIRLKELREQHRESQAQLARIIGVAQSTVGMWESGESSPKYKTLLKLAEHFDVSIDYLTGGASPQTKPAATVVRIPVLGVVPAGVPLEAIQDILDYEEISADMAATGEFFGLRIRGSSMEPHIREGDVVIIRCQATADTGDTAVVMVNGDDATVKRIKKEPDGGIWLIPNNPAYDARHFSPAEIETLPVTILGKVVELRRVFR